MVMKRERGFNGIGCSMEHGVDLRSLITSALRSDEP